MSPHDSTAAVRDASISGHWSPGSQALQEAARARFTASGEQWTDLRAQLFDELARSEDPASAYDMAERLSARTARRISANSVYRILDLFVAKDLARRIESRNAYVVNTHPSCAHDCIFLICEQCSRISHLDDDSLAQSMRTRARESGFSPRRPVLELLGLCKNCQA